jgi:hypothetical protein
MAENMQLITQVFVFILLFSAFGINIYYADKHPTFYRKLKVVVIAASIILSFKTLSKYSLIFIIVGVISLIEKKKKNNGTESTTMDNN